MFYTVYKITNLVNDKIYIGVHKTFNLDDDYMGSGKLIKRTIDKYGIDNFKKEYIEVFDNAEDMFNMESQLVNEEFVSRDDTYNLKEGGFGGFDYINTSRLNNTNNSTENAIKAMNKRNIELNKDKEFVKSKSRKVHTSMRKKSLNMFGNETEIYKTFKCKKHSNETKKRIGEVNSKHQSGSGNSQYGTMWIYSLTEKVSKKIKKEELSTYEQQGWLKGRKMKFS